MRRGEKRLGSVSHPTPECSSPFPSADLYERPKKTENCALGAPRDQLLLKTETYAVLRCPLTYVVNGQQHSSSCFVCNSQYHGLVQGGAPAPATGGPVRARLLPLPPGHSPFRPLVPSIKDASTNRHTGRKFTSSMPGCGPIFKEMRIASVN
jgi:hypothetical protein